MKALHRPQLAAFSERCRATLSGQAGRELAANSPRALSIPIISVVDNVSHPRISHEMPQPRPLHPRKIRCYGASRRQGIGEPMPGIGRPPRSRPGTEAYFVSRSRGGMRVYGVSCTNPEG